MVEANVGETVVSGVGRRKINNVEYWRGLEKLRQYFWTELPFFS